MAFSNMAKIYAKWVKNGTKKFQSISPEDFKLQVYAVLEEMVQNHELTEEELNNLLE